MTTTSTKRRRLAPWLCAWGLAATLGAHAQTFMDPALEALYVADKSDELQRLSSARVAAQPDDAQAVLGVALAALERDDAPTRLAAIQRAQACIDKQPKAAPCHYALGVTMGVQAMSEGMMKMARSLGTLKDALTQAHTLEPDWYPARSALIEFHLEVPGLMGGSTSKATELARGATRPGQAKALEARVALQDKKYEAALQGLQSLPPGTEAAVLNLKTAVDPTRRAPGVGSGGAPGRRFAGRCSPAASPSGRSSATAPQHA